MIKKIQDRFALSRQGAIGLIKGSIACFLQNITFMIPVSLLYMLVMDFMNGADINSRVWIYVVGGVLAIAVISLAATFQYNSTYIATYKESKQCRITLAERLRKMPLSYFGKKDLSDLANVIMQDCAMTEQSFSHFVPELIGGFMSTTLICICLFAFDWRMALAAIWVLPVAIAIVLSAKKVLQNKSKKLMKAKLECADGIQECIECMKDLKCNNAELKYTEQLEKKIRKVEKITTINEWCSGVFVTSAQFVLKLGIVTIVLVGAILMVQGTLPLATFLLFAIVAACVYDPVLSILQNLTAVIVTDESIQRISQIVNGEIQQGSKELINKGVDMKFENVSFAYGTGEKVIDNVTFEAKQGEVTALIGPSGSGKTTVTRLATRFWDIDSGKITVGGMDISSIDPESLLSLYSIVFQDVVLFDNSIMENIRIGNKQATDEQVLAAAKLANCQEFAEKLPDKWNTNIGENGCRLSGGERQRISIARAFLKNAPIILLDEATASLDTENETSIQNALSKLIKDKTVLVIAHRMRTIANADKIVVLDQGQVSEQGRPSELLANNGIYAHMVQLQNASADWQV